MFPAIAATLAASLVISCVVFVAILRHMHREYDRELWVAQQQTTSANDRADLYEALYASSNERSGRLLDHIRDLTRESVA